MELKGETVKQLYSSNGSGNMSAVATKAARIRLGGDGRNESNGKGENVAWLGGSGKTARRQQNQQREDRNRSNGGGTDLTRRQWQ